MEHLRQMAGAAPSRLGAHERAAREQRPEQILEALHQEERLEATEDVELYQGLEELEAAIQDPTQRLLLLQMKQTQMLAKKVFQTKSYDPIHQALSGGGSSDAASSGSGIKGCLAREAYQKVAADLERMGDVVMTNALVDLGLSLEPSAVAPGLHDAIGRPSTIDTNRVSVRAWMGTSSPVQQPADDGILCKGSDVHRSGSGRRGPHHLGLVDDCMVIQTVQKNRHRASMAPFSRLAPSLLDIGQRGLHEGFRLPRRSSQGREWRSEECRSGKGRGRARQAEEALEAKTQAGRRELSFRPGLTPADEDDPLRQAHGSPLPEPCAQPAALMTAPPERNKSREGGRSGEGGLPEPPLFRCANGGPSLPERIERVDFFRVALSVASQRGGLASFARLSMQPIRNEDRPGSASLWGRWTPLSSMSPRRRRKCRFLRAKADALRWVVIALDWLTLGHAERPPDYARAGFPMSRHQEQMLDVLDEQLSYFFKGGSVSKESLGRAGEKLEVESIHEAGV